MEIDLHGLELWAAIEEVLYHLEECHAKGVREISIIHGFHGGQILKNYFQSDGFLSEMARNGFKLLRKESPYQGMSCFILIK